tara:strand:+ start:228 stop:806 length:579 start_codon:yes stop_codon:yes gene_type:complete
MRSPGEKRKKFFNNLIKKSCSFWYDWFGDISLPSINYLNPKDKNLKTKWYYFYANVMTFILILLDIIQWVVINTTLTALWEDEKIIDIYIINPSPILNSMVVLYSFLYLISIIYRFFCRSYLMKFDLKAYKIIKFYNIYLYIVSLFTIYLIEFVTGIRGLNFGGILALTSIFIVWSLPNLIYFRRRLYMFND